MGKNIGLKNLGKNSPRGDFLYVNKKSWENNFGKKKKVGNNHGVKNLLEAIVIRYPQLELLKVKFMCK